MKKNYMKLIGSIICALSVIIMVGTIAIGAQADDKKIEFVEGVTYTADNTIPTAPEGYSEEDGYLFAGWYVADKSDSVDGYSPEREPVTGEEYCAKYVPSEVLGLKAQISAQIKDNDTDKIQNSSVDNAIRFVTSLDSTEYNHIGFNIKIAGTSYNQDAAVSKDVYTQIYGIGADKEKVITYVPKDEFHSVSKYVKTYTFTTIPEAAFDSDIKVTPYWITLDGTRVDGPETVIRTVNYCRAWVYVDDSENAVTNEAAPVGTSSNPYGDLQTALNVDGQTLDPKVILKSDYELSATVTASQSLTLASVKDDEENVKSITRADSWTAGRMLTVGSDSAVNVTLENITINACDLGAGVMVNNGTLVMEDGSTVTQGKAGTGANVMIDDSNTCTLTMNEGSVISDGNATQYGGNVLLKKGTLNLNGGTITGGTATASASVTNKNYGCGGNIHSFANGNIVITKGTISNGKVTSPVNVISTGIGGNICSAGTVTINGGTISGGSAISTSDTVTNISVGCGGNIYSTGTVNVNGGVITGGSAASTCSSTVSPSITVDETITEGNYGCGGNIYSTNKVNVSDGTITSGTATNGGNIYSTTTLEVSGGTIDGGSTDDKKITNATLGGGNIYTSGTLTMTGGTIKGGRANAESPAHTAGIGGNICAAGWKNADDEIQYATVTITGGTVESGYANGRGGNIDAHQNAKLSLGDKDATSNDAAKILDGNGSVSGGNIFARDTYSEVEIYDGITISGGTATGYGGNIFYDGEQKVTLYGGVISDGEAGSGGNVHMERGTLDVQGGTISGGEAKNGGNIYLQGSANKSAVMTMNGGTVSGGTATGNGGNIYLAANTAKQATMTMDGGTVSGGTATVNGGNIYLSAAVNSTYDGGAGATFTMNNGTISGGKAVLGGSVYINRASYKVDKTTTWTGFEATMTIKAGLIEKGWATGEGGGNIYCRGILTMDGGTITSGIAGTSEKKGRGGNVFVKADSATAEAGEMHLNGGEVINGYATERGGNIHLAHASLYLGAGEINVTGGDIVTITGTEADSLVFTTTDTTVYDNVSLFSNSTRNIKINDKLNENSRIYVSASTDPTSNKIKAIANILTAEVETEEFYASILIYEGEYTIKLKNANELWYE